MVKPPSTIPCLPIKRATVSTRAGSDPDEIDCATEAVGDFPDTMEPCLLSPVGQCQYDHHDGFTNCIHCGKGDGVL